MEMHVNNCVWISRWETIKDAAGKTRRVRRARPKVYAGTVYTVVRPVRRGDRLRPFVGWTKTALQRGMPARHYGRPTAVFSSAEEMWRFVQWYEALVNWALEYGHTWFGGSRIQVGWDGVRRSGPTSCANCEYGDCPYQGREDVEPCGGYIEHSFYPTPNFTPFGNLVWARVRGLRQKHTDESMALLDLEQITRTDKYDPYIRVMHAYPRDYDNGGVYATEIVHVYSDRAERVINGKEA